MKNSAIGVLFESLSDLYTGAGRSEAFPIKDISWFLKSGEP